MIGEYRLVKKGFEHLYALIFIQFFGDTVLQCLGSRLPEGIPLDATALCTFIRSYIS